MPALLNPSLHLVKAEGLSQRSSRQTVDCDGPDDHQERRRQQSSPPPRPSATKGAEKFAAVEAATIPRGSIEPMNIRWFRVNSVPMVDTTATTGEPTEPEPRPVPRLATTHPKGVRESPWRRSR